MKLARFHENGRSSTKYITMKQKKRNLACTKSSTLLQRNGGGGGVKVNEELVRFHEKCS